MPASGQDGSPSRPIQKDRAALGTTAHLPFVTLSRQAGAGAETVARVLAEKLNANLPKDAQP